MSCQYHEEAQDFNVTHMCRLYLLTYRKFIVRGDKAIHLLSTLAPIVMKMEVAPVFVMAWLVLIARAFKYCSMGLPNIAHAVAAIEVGAANHIVQLEVTTVAVSSST
jgi:hypothetical protein